MLAWIQTASGRPGKEGSHAFPVCLNISGEQSPAIPFTTPPLIDQFDPATTGVVHIRDDGQQNGAWGLLTTQGGPAGHGPLGKKGQARVVRIAAEARANTFVRDWADGVQFLARHDGQGTWILAVRTPESEAAAARLGVLEKEANALRRVSRALNMNQTVEPTALQAAYAVSGALDLESAHVWLKNEELTLRHTAGSGPMTRGDHRPDTVLRQALATDQAQWESSGKGGRAALPLHTGENTLGVLELVAKAPDQRFIHERALHLTIAELLSFALHNAQVFETAERLATTDPLTGIANHRTMQEFLRRQVTLADKTGQRLGAVMVDVDHFRQFNEEEGHDCGDNVLKLVADALRKTVGPNHLAARYGGEEFALILPGLDAQDTIQLAEQARQNIADIRYIPKSGQPRKITASLGCAVYPDQGYAAEELLKAADTALYQAKRSGRNRAILAEPKQNPESAPDPHPKTA